jgi:hypothetical protein
MNRLRRAFIVAWIALAIAGALDHTIAQHVLGRTIDLGLPHLQYGYVMFDANPRRVPVITYARRDGERHDAAELDPRPAFGYARARLALDAMFNPIYLRDLCNRNLRDAGDAITIYVDGYDLDADPDHPTITSTVTCDARPPR